MNDPDQSWRLLPTSIACAFLAAASGLMLALPAHAQCDAARFIDGFLPCGQSIGDSLDIHDTTMAIGDTNYGVLPDHTGGVFILERVGRQWVETGLLLASDGVGSDRFGHAVAISGDTIIVGSQHSSPNGAIAAGSAYVFERFNGSWVETQKLLASNMSSNSRFGYSVDIDGDTIVVGAIQASVGAYLSGAVYVFERQFGGWTQVAMLVAEDVASYDQLGESVALSGNRLVAPTPGKVTTATNAGAVYVFEKIGAVWMQTAKIFPQDTFSGHGYGADVALEGTRLFVGATKDNDAGDKTGAIYFYELEGFSWQLRQKVYPIVPEWLSRFGQALAVSGSMLVVGEPTAEGPATNSGAFSVFRDTPAGWQPVLRFTHPSGDAHSHLGDSVAIYGEHVAAGAPKAQNGNPQCYVGNVWFLDVPLHTRAYCFGTSCPCGNDDPTAGCAHGGGSGARLAGCGSGSVGLDDATFQAEGLAPNQPAMLFRARNPVNGGAGMPIGDGLLCATGQTRRFDVRFADPAGRASWGPTLAQAGAWQPGDTHTLQAWYRAPTSSPCNTGFNTTNAVETTFGP